MYRRFLPAVDLLALLNNCRLRHDNPVFIGMQVMAGLEAHIGEMHRDLTFNQAKENNKAVMIDSHCF